MEWNHQMTQQYQEQQHYVNYAIQVKLVATNGYQRTIYVAKMPNVRIQVDLLVIQNPLIIILISYLFRNK